MTVSSSCLSVCDVELAGFFLAVVVELAGLFFVELAVCLVDLSLAGMAGAGVGGRLRQATVRLQAAGAGHWEPRCCIL